MAADYRRPLSDNRFRRLRPTALESGVSDVAPVARVRGGVDPGVLRVAEHE